jgi:hypothetical protein
MRGELRFFVSRKNRDILENEWTDKIKLPFCGIKNLAYRNDKLSSIFDFIQNRAKGSARRIFDIRRKNINNVSAYRDICKA